MSKKEQPLLDISGLKPRPGSRTVRKRVGFGEGSGLGKTCGKGQKGSKSRSGYTSKAGFEGGQMPLYRRLPKVGFTSRQRVLGKNTFRIVSLKKLLELGKEQISFQDFVAIGITSEKERVKILGGCECSKKIVVEAHAISEAARDAINKAGGEVKLLS